MLKSLIIACGTLSLIGGLLVLIPLYWPDPEPRMGSYCERRPLSMFSMLTGIGVLIAAWILTVTTGALAVFGG